MNQAVNNQSERLLTIGQVTALTGVGKSTIRHWENEFRDILNSVRTGGNQRRFSDDAVQKISVIKELVEDHGLTLRGVRMKLEALNDNSNKPEVEPKPPENDRLHKLADLMSEHIIKRLFQER